MGAKAERIGRLTTGEELVRMAFDLTQAATDLAADPKAADIWVHCLPGGADIVARDCRRFRVDNLSEVAANTELPLLVDWEHRSDGDDTRAAGWIEEFRIEPESAGERAGLWGRLRCTPTGREHVVKQDYRFLSPVVMGKRGADKVLHVMKLGAVALTNRPALKMRGIELLREQLSTRFGAFETDKPEDPPMKNLAALVAAACGLEANASEEDLVEALKPKLAAKKGKQQRESESGEETAPLREALSTMTTERNTATARVTELETELASFRQTSFKQTVETFFADGARAGKIQPANRDAWLQMALKSEANFALFKDTIYPGLPVVGAPQSDGKQGAGKRGKEKLSGKSSATGIDYDALKSIGLTPATIRESERELFRAARDGNGPGDDEDDDDEDDDDQKDDGDTSDKEGAPAGA